MTSDDLRRLTERYVARLVDAWPNRNIAEEDMLQALRIAVDSNEEGPVLVIELLGVSTWLGFDGSAEAAATEVDAHARHMAEELEGDRWTAGEGWRECRS